MRLMVTKFMVVSWLVSMMLQWSPPERRNSYIPEAKENLEDARARYTTIAEEFLSVAMSPDAPKLFGGKQGRLRTAMLMSTVALYESGYRRDVHLGIGKLGRGDHGRSWCLMQINVGTGTVPSKNPTISSWKGADLVGIRNTSNCARAGLDMLDRSMRACSKLPLRDRLSAYTSGKCQIGETKGINRLNFAFSRFDRNKPSFSDEEARVALRGTPDETLEPFATRLESRPGIKAGPIFCRPLASTMHSISLSHGVRMV